MFVDASAIVAIILREDEWAGLASRLEAAATVYVSPMVLWEAVSGVAKEVGMTLDQAEDYVDTFARETKAVVVPIDGAVGALARDAFRRFGKGRHAARLNFGDCFAYACARHLGVPLLFKGNDFPLTDIEAA